MENFVQIYVCVNNTRCPNTETYYLRYEDVTMTRPCKICSGVMLLTRNYVQLRLNKQDPPNEKL